jgi:beta-glucosidase
LQAQGKAVQTLKDSDHGFDVGTVVDLNAVHPISDSKKNEEAADRHDQFWNRWFIDPVLKGEYPPLMKKTSLKPTKNEMDLIKQPLDFLGVNYYTRILVTHDASVPVTEARTVQKKTPATEMGWEIYPEGLHEMLVRFRTEYGNPRLYVTENGAAFEDVVTRKGEVQDDDRIAYLRDHILSTQRALKDGVYLKGYFTWTLMDNFEWTEGYRKLFGLVHERNRKRRHHAIVRLC